MHRVVPTLFFCSGAAALLFETLWFRQAGLTLGNTVWASSIVLAAFMAGLALGNLLAARLAERLREGLQVYAGLELTIALSGLALVFGLPELGPALARPFEALSGSFWLLNGARLLVAFACLALPAVAMGATLPVLTRHLVERGLGFGASLGRLYGWNTLGGVCGALVGELLLLEWLGVSGTAGVAAGLALTAAAGASALARRAPPDPPAGPRPPTTIPRAAWPALAGAALTGAALLALEVVWFRFLILFFPATGWSFAVMLSVVLVGIALGGLLGGRLLARWPGSASWAAPLCWASCALVVGGYAAFDPRGSLAFRAHTWAGAPATVVTLAGELMLPVSLLSGLIYTLLGARVHASLGQVGPAAAARASGRLTMWNTSGALLGSTLAGFVLLPVLGVERSLWAVAGVYAVAGALLLRPPRAPRLALGLAAAGAALALVAFPRGAFEQRFLAISAERFLEGRRVVEQRESLYGTLRMAQRDFLGEPLDQRLIHDGYSIAATTVAGQRYMKLFGYLPVALHPAPRRALVIAYGLGQTTRALVGTPWLEAIHVADPSVAVLEMRRWVFAPEEDPLADPRVRVHREDGRFLLQTTSLAFDIITGEPPPPKMASVGALYSREFFGAIRDRLAPGGIASYWLPCQLLTGADALAIIRAWLDVFPDATLWQGADQDLILLGSRDARPAPAAWGRQWGVPHVQRELADVGFERPDQLACAFLADAAQLEALAADALPVTDDDPYRLSPDPPGDCWDLLGPWVAPEAALARYGASPWAAAWLPALAPETASALFGVQAALERVLREGPAGVPLRVLDRALRQTDLRTPALWLLGSSARKQRIAARVGERGGALAAWHLAVGALADRDYAAAGMWFARCAEADPAHADRPRLLQAYALAQAGRIQDARALAPAAPDDDWRWLWQTWG